MSSDLELFKRQSLTSVERQISRRFQETLDGSNHVLINPSLLEDQTKTYDGVIFSRKYFDLLTLILLTWYSDYCQGFEGYVRFEIEQYLHKRLLFPDLAASLVDRHIVLAVILSYSKCHNLDELFGNILSPQQIIKVATETRLRMIHLRNPRRLVRRRGYKDKGSTRPSHRWLPRDDWSFTEEQNLIEEKREQYRAEVTSIVRTIGGRLLADGLFSERRLPDEHPR